jgi:tetratricopeptide (TPR) repeat protein
LLRSASKANPDISKAVKSGDAASVRAAYQQRQKSPKTEIVHKPAKDAAPVKDVLEEILDAALPGRVRSNAPEFGDLESLKKHVRDQERIAGEAALNSASSDQGEQDIDAYLRRKALEDSEEVEEDGFGVDAPVAVPQEVFELNAQAQFAFLKEEYVEALEYLERSLQLIKSVLGDQHNEAATVMVSMAQVYERLKNFDSASELLNEAVAIRRLVDGPVHSSVAVALNKLAHVQTCQKKFPEALKSSRQAQRIIEAAQAQNDHELAYYRSHQSTYSLDSPVNAIYAV